VAIVVSEVHARYWVLVLTVSSDFYDSTNGTFEEMIARFEITLQPPTGSPRPRWPAFSSSARLPRRPRSPPSSC